jgi:hypothetical protein
MADTSVVLLSIVALLLFYRFVEKRHKLVVGKLVLVIVGLAALGIGVLLASNAYSSWREAADRSHVSIAFSADTSATGAEADRLDTTLSFLGRSTDRIAFRICNHGDDTVLSVAFRPKAHRFGHSTVYDVDQTRDGSLGVLESDDIVAPASCVLVPFFGTFQLYDTVFTQIQDVKTSRTR